MIELTSGDFIFIKILTVFILYIPISTYTIMYYIDKRINDIEKKLNSK